jgi:hypothetical protein
MSGADVSGEWTAATSQYLLDAARHGSHTLDLSYAVLQRVALGTLTPAAIRETLPRFAETHGPRYASELAQANADFFGTLLQIVTGATEPAPAFDASRPMDWFVRVTDYTTRHTRPLARSYEELAFRAANGSSTTTDLHAQVSADYNRRGAEQLHAMTRLYFDVLTRVSRLNASFEREYFSALLAAGTETLTQTRVELTAAIGERSTVVLAIENTRNEPADLYCTLTDLRRVDGVGPAFAPDSLIDIDRPVLEPGEEANVRLSIHLAPERFVPGLAYVGAMRVARRGDPPFDVPLQVVATARSSDAG